MIVDSGGKVFHIEDYVVVNKKVPLMERLISRHKPLWIEPTHVRRRDFDLLEIKRAIIEIIRQDEDYWSSSGNIDEIIEDIEAAQTINEIARNLYGNG
jgi:hypothetical protein